MFSLVPVVAASFPAGTTPATTLSGDPFMNLGTILIVVVVLILLGRL